MCEDTPIYCAYLQIDEYQEAEATARKEHRSLWRYGDFTGTEF